MTPEISVVMSVYNGEEYLEESIASISDQTFSDFEFIIINDASTDSSLDIIEAMAVRDKRIVVLNRKENSGLAKALNAGIGIAKGKYIARQDADDLSLPERLENQRNFLANNQDFGVCATNAWIAGRDALPVYSYDFPPSDEYRDNFPGLLLNNKHTIFHGSVMIRKSVIKTLDPVYRFRYGQDYDLWLRLCNITSFCVLQKQLYVYRRIDSNTGAIADYRRNALVEVMLKLYAERRENGKELTDWKEEENKILNSKECQERDKRKTNYSEAYMKLLAGRRMDALKGFLAIGKDIKFWPLIFLCLMPGACLIVRKLHSFVNRNAQEFKTVWHD